ncbi:UMP kinase [archaeon]|nr:UMP kinase [archaeon]
MKIIISLGGSLLTSDFSAANIQKYADEIINISKKNKVIVVIGGGKIARQYIDIADELNCNDYQKDYVAIKLTRANAAIFASALGNYAEQEIKTTYLGITNQYNMSEKIIVCGGTAPGQSTDGVSANLAKKIKADLMINATNIDGVYDKNPAEFKNAKKIDKLSYDQFLDILKNNEQAPGKYGLCDYKAVKILKEKKIPLIVVDGTNPKEIYLAVKGNHHGSTIN